MTRMEPLGLFAEEAAAHGVLGVVGLDVLQPPQNTGSKYGTQFASIR